MGQKTDHCKKVKSDLMLANNKKWRKLPKKVFVEIMKEIVLISNSEEEINRLAQKRLNYSYQIAMSSRDGRTRVKFFDNTGREMVLEK